MENILEIINNDDWKQGSFMLPTILLIHTGGKASRDFIESLSGEEYASFDSIIDWYNPNDYEKMYSYLEDNHFPSPTDFPTAIVFLPATHTYAKDKQDQIARLAPKEGQTLTYKMIVQDGLWAMIECIIEDRMMSESYKVMRIKEKLMMNSKIAPGVLQHFMNCNTVNQLKLMHQRLSQEEMLLKVDYMMVEELKSEGIVDLGVKIDLFSPPELVPVPDWYKKKKEQPLQLVMSDQVD